jgi:uncharacterized Tic20 family protein
MNPRPDEKTWAMWCHLTAFAALLGIPFGSIIGPMIAWQIKKDESAFVDEQGKESVNFQISILLYTVAAFIALFLFFFLAIGMGMLGAGVSASGSGEISPIALLPFLIGAGLIGPFFGLFLFPLVGMILTILAAVKASNGEHYRYPFTIRFLR